MQALQTKRGYTVDTCSAVLQEQYPIPSVRPLIQPTIHPLLFPELCLCFQGEPADPWPLANESDNKD